ncbi:MAG: hypothetical protein AB7N91_18235 [Candidatus Tectimicrobiota bacterium]
MQKPLGALLAALLMAGVLSTVEPAQAQVSIRSGPRPSPNHIWIPERRFWNGRRYVRVPGYWSSRRRDHFQPHRWGQRPRERRWEHPRGHPRRREPYRGYHRPWEHRQRHRR